MRSNPLNYHHLLYFWAVARKGSVKLASQSLHVSQPSISTQLKQLEGCLGTPLFARRSDRTETSYSSFRTWSVGERDLSGRFSGRAYYAIGRAQA
jgi:molybdenum-dependent DNA-binding transcriptional regulator ModE